MNSCYDTKHCPDELQSTPEFTHAWRNYHDLYRIASAACRGSLWAEFGVGVGKTARRLLDRLPVAGRLFLFDSWQGIPTDWDLGRRMTNPKGSYSFDKPRIQDTRACFIDGWFKDTLPHEFGHQLGLVHLDCDVYESAHDVLFGLGHQIGAGTVLIFDELLGYERYAKHEYKALCEWRQQTGHQINWLAKERFAAVGVVE